MSKIDVYCNECFIEHDFTNRCRMESCAWPDCENPLKPTKRCSKCSMKYYCSKECQKEDWIGGHKIQCCPNSLFTNRENKTLRTAAHYNFFTEFQARKYYDSFGIKALNNHIVVEFYLYLQEFII